MTIKRCSYYDDTYILLISVKSIFTNYLPEWYLKTYQHTHNYEEEIASDNPDILLLDFSMPKYGGDIIVTKMKPKYPHIIYVVFTADISEANIELYQELGFDSLMPKDIENKDFVSRFTKIADGENLWN